MPTDSFYRRYGKRMLDVVLALTSLMVLWPVLLAVGVGVWWFLGRPLLFRQWRPGRHGVPFCLYKFRTMRDEVDPSGEPLPDHFRLDRFGRMLRATSLDELPEIWNILRGEMSFVGPRPLLREYLTLYDSRQARRHDVLPGLTGMAQIRGRNLLAWDERLETDVYYVDHLSFGLDLRILLSTPGNILRGRGVAAVGHATMPRFTGSKKLKENTSKGNTQRVA